MWPISTYIFKLSYRTFELTDSWCNFLLDPPTNRTTQDKD